MTDTSSRSRDTRPEQPTGDPRPYKDPDEINLLEYAYVLIRSKWLLIGVGVLGLALGYVAAKIKGPTYTATAVIAPRETEGQKVPKISGLGMFGGMVASELGLGGNASLEHLEIVLDSRKFSAEMLEAKNLLPELHRHEWPEKYEEAWDSVGGMWKVDSLVVPYPAAGGYVKEELLSKEINKNNTMNIRMSHSDSLFAYTMLSGVLEYLDAHVRTSVQDDARENRMYLETQLVNVTDPLLRQKIQELIAAEVEKQMVVSKEAFRTIDPVYVSKDYKEKKLYPIVFAFGLTFLVVLFVIFEHALFSSDKTAEDQQYLESIKRELTSLPFGKSGKKA